MITTPDTLLQLAADWAEARAIETRWQPGQSVDVLTSARATRARFRAVLAGLLADRDTAHLDALQAEADTAAARRFANTALDRAVDAEVRAARAEARAETLARQLQAAREAGRAALERARRGSSC